jgi:hypothetical protein
LILISYVYSYSYSYSYPYSYLYILKPTSTNLTWGHDFWGVRGSTYLVLAVSYNFLFVPLLLTDSRDVLNRARFWPWGGAQVELLEYSSSGRSV